MKTGFEDTGKNLVGALDAMNQYLSVINGRLEMLMNSDLPDYIVSDLATIYQAEKEVSQIVRSLNIYCHKTF